MTFKLIDQPVKIALKQYNDLRTKLVNQLLSEGSVLSVYQMGSVKDPGISDLDIICIFKNDSTCNADLRNNLTINEKKILTHGIFGLEVKDLEKTISYNLLSNLKFLGGENLNLDENQTIFSQELKDQIALEYMIKMYITLDTQIKLKTVKLRSFLLLGKAIKFDLELLGIKDGELFNLVNKILDYRSTWFKNKHKEKEIKELVLSFYLELEQLLMTILEKEDFYLPYNNISLPGNFKILRGEYFHKDHRGIVLPSVFQFMGKKFINLQYRLNEFKYYIPYKIPGDSTLLDDRFKFSKQMVSKNMVSYPHYMAITSSLSIY
ncbi:hypothetical protein [Winogradskyella sp. MIT101101]|uniref:hypothetical protein n=1 Tax=Winogradskyella sp. MIT101101 TaxID=3098297 RepID=UPI003999EC88